MKDQIVGEIDIYPWVTANVKTNIASRKINFVVDTGFDGEIALPRAYVSSFGASRNYREYVFGDGNLELSMTVTCNIEWLDGYLEVTAVYIDGPNPLIGMELLDGCLVTLEIENGQGQITIEPNT